MKKRFDYPLAFYATQKQVEENKKYIYHYTNAKSFWKILHTMSLKLSKFEGSNDLNEANLANVDRIHDVLMLKALESFIGERCSYLSFVQDGNIEMGEPEGTNHPRMWSQYAQNGEGVCLVLDKEKFLNINKKELCNKFHKLESVKYGFKNGANVIIKDDYSSGKEEELIKKHYKELFFKKHLDWKQEKEKRLFGIDLPNFLSIKGAIEYICLGPKFIKNNDSVCKLVDIITDSKSECFDYLVPQSFADMTPYSYGYFVDNNIATNILIHEIKKLSIKGKVYEVYMNKYCMGDASMKEC